MVVEVAVGGGGNNNIIIIIGVKEKGKRKKGKKKEKDVGHVSRCDKRFVYVKDFFFPQINEKRTPRKRRKRTI